MNTPVSIEEDLRTLEEELLQADVRKTAARLDELLAEEFIEFGSSGRVFNKRDIIDALRSESAARRLLTDFKTRVLGPGLVLATYRAISYGAPDEQPTHSLRSSLWKFIDSRWQMVFHQGTPSTKR